MTKFLFCILAILIFHVPLPAQINKNGDFQIWGQTGFGHSFNQSLELRLIGQARWADDARIMHVIFGEGQIAYKVKKCEIATGYRHQYSLADRRWVLHYVPMSDLTFFFKCKWDLEDRNRVMYFIPEDSRSDTVWTYRNRLRAISPQITDFLKTKFFIDNEMFFVERLGFEQNRFSFGFHSTLASYLQSRVFYTYRTQKGAEKQWAYQNILQLQLQVQF